MLYHSDKSSTITVSVGTETVSFTELIAFMDSTELTTSFTVFISFTLSTGVGRTTSIGIEGSTVDTGVGRTTSIGIEGSTVE